MEDPCLVMSSTSNFFENFLDQKKTTSLICGDLSDLPILGQLEQLLEQSVDQQRMRMSPDSTMNPQNSIGIHRNSHPESPDQSPSDQVPDSTTSDLAYDSDAFNSEDSCQSFPDVTSNGVDIK